MPKRIGTLLLGLNKDKIEKICKENNLNDYETEIIMRVYWKRQSLNFVADNMEFDKYGKTQKYYSVRSINNFHKEAFKKIVDITPDW